MRKCSDKLQVRIILQNSWSSCQKFRDQKRQGKTKELSHLEKTQGLTTTKCNVECGILDQTLEHKDCKGKTGEISTKSVVYLVHCTAVNFSLLIIAPWSCKMLTPEEAGGRVHRHSMYCLCNSSVNL